MFVVQCVIVWPGPESDYQFYGIRDGPLFFIGGGGGYFFVKKLFASCSWLKKLFAKQKEFFWNTLIFKILTQIGLDIKVSFSFI